MGMFGNKEPAKCDPTRILVVDDEAPIRKLFQMILADAFPNAKIELACNGLEAVRLFREGHHGAITLDLRMPEMDGLEAFHVIEKFCEEENLRMPPVVFCTGFAPPDTVNDIVNDGAYHCLLRKPVRSDVVINAVMRGVNLTSGQA